jgi:hypothetical protein
MSAFIEGATVTVAEVAKATRGTIPEVTAEAETLGLYVGADWGGRAALSTADAHRLASGSARREAEHAAAWAAFTAVTEAWEKARETAHRTARESTYDAAIRRGSGVPAASSSASQAGVEAVERFERKHKPPTFGGQAMSRSWIDRAGNRIRETVQ